MGYDRGDNFPSNFEPNGIPLGLNERKTVIVRMGENCPSGSSPVRVIVS